MRTVSVRDAKAQLSMLLNSLEDEDICIVNHGRPVGVLRKPTVKDVPNVARAVADDLKRKLDTAAAKPSVTLAEFKAGKRTYASARPQTKKARVGR